MSTELITLKLTPKQAKILWQTIDGAADAGACEGGLTKDEAEALGTIIKKLMKTHALWMHADNAPSLRRGRG